ncbi:unnamed protein product, partial [Staurois parvus]
IHYIWSPTVHRTWKCNYCSKLWWFIFVTSISVQQSTGYSLLEELSLGRCGASDLCLDSADWPCADHMHSPKKKKLP